MVSNKTNNKGQKSESKYVFAELYIGKDSDKYIKIFEKITKGKFIVPSIPAGIFGLSWLIYRKVAKYGFILYIMSVISVYMLVADMENLSKGVKMLAIFGASHIMFFFIGNFVYWLNVRRKIDFCREKYGDVSSMTYLAEEGGTLGPVILIASVLAMQGFTMLIVYGLLSADAFFANLWNSIQQLINL